MKAILVHEFGGPEVLKLEEIPTPKPQAGQVLVKIHAAGVNPYDTYMRTGTYAVKPPLPYTPGSDAAGVVEAVGPGVTKVKPGDRVYTAKTITGAYAEYTLTLEDQAQKLPANITFDQGAAIWVPYGTAYHALRQEANARAGETVLVHGASGGVGTASLQIARAMGLTVFGTAGTDKGLDLVKREGAHQVFNHTKSGYTDEILKATAGRGVDIVLEMLANVNLAADLKLLATYRGFTLWAATESETAEIHAALYAGFENGTLRPVIGKEIPLAEAARAHKEVMAPGASGKIILVP